MPKALILGDDLTGLNGCCVMLSDLGLGAYTIVDCQSGAMPEHDYDCVGVNLDSRARTAQVAARRVRECAERYSTPGTLLYSKRIDSTLRGNLGAECDALLDYVGPHAVSVIVPAFPTAGRSYIDGSILVNGVPLAATSVAQDPKNPIKTSSPAQLFGEQSRYSVGSVPLHTLVNGELPAKIREFAAAGVRNILVETVTDQDVDMAARATLQSGVPFIAVDPGPFTAALAKNHHELKGSGETVPPGVRVHATSSKVLAAIGSVNAVAREQVQYLLQSEDVATTLLEVENILNSPSQREAAIAQCVREILHNAEDCPVCCLLLSSIDPQRQVDFAPYLRRENTDSQTLSGRINDAVAETVCRVLERQEDIGGIFTSGGDITIAVCRRLGAPGMLLCKEVIPLAAMGQVIDHAGRERLIVTKGGMVGGPDATAFCIRELQSTMNSITVKGLKL